MFPAWNKPRVYGKNATIFLRLAAVKRKIHEKYVTSPLNTPLSLKNRRTGRHTYLEFCWKLETKTFAAAPDMQDTIHAFWRIREVTCYIIFWRVLAGNWYLIVSAAKKHGDRANFYIVFDFFRSLLPNRGIPEKGSYVK